MEIIAEYGQAVISHRLILDRAAHNHVVVAVVPVVGNALHKPVNPFGEKEEPEVAPLPNHLPAFGAPLVGIFQQEIGCEAGEHNPSALNLPRFVAPALYRQIEVARLSAFAARDVAAVHLVLTVNVAIFASGADFCASVPRIPVGINCPVF